MFLLHISALLNATAQVTALEALKASISALEKCIDGLEALSPKWETISLWSSIAVVIGVSAEIVGQLWTHREESEAWGRGIIRPPDRPSRLKFWVEITATVTVILGISGEIAASNRLANLNSKLRSKTSELRSKGDQLVSLVEQQSGSAASSASQAQQSATDAKGESEHAKQMVGSVKTTTDRLNEHLADTSLKVDSVEAKRANLQRSLVGLAVCNAPRVIANWFAGNKTYVDPLRQMAGQNVSIEFVRFDAEARRAAMSLARALIAADWKVQQPLTSTDSLKDGVTVEAFPVRADPYNPEPYRRANERADALVAFLHSYNWEAKSEWAIKTPAAMPAGTLRIQVGLYPAMSYVSSPASADFDRAVENSREENKKAAEESERQMLALQPPASRKETRRLLAERQAEAEKFRAQFTSPCVPMPTQ